MMETLNVSQKEIHFENEVTEDHRPKSGWQPTEQLREYFPFSGIGLQLGAHYTFAKKKSGQ